jgi:cell division protein FtsL
MAVAAPVLEKSASTKEQKSEQFAETYRRSMTEDERHNAQISSNYKRLIDPDSTIDEVMSREEKPVQQVFVNAPVEAKQQTPYLVQRARADADIFRADSAINRVAILPQPIIDEVDEEEDEDLRPTKTTIQYKTADNKPVDEVKPQIKSKAVSHISLTRRDKIIIASVVAVIVALFALIIINSAIITSLTSDITYLQSTLNTAREEYDNAYQSVNEYMENLPDIVSEYAESRGMVLMR